MDQRIREIVEIFERLTPDDRREALAYLAALVRGDTEGSSSPSRDFRESAERTS